MKLPKGVYLRKNPNAPSATERERIKADRDAAVQSLNEAHAELKSLAWMASELIAAARFAIDVDGDDPSWTQFIEATKRAERHAELSERIGALRKERDRLQSQIHGKRYTALRNESFFAVVVAEADTKEQLAEILENNLACR